MATARKVKEIPDGKIKYADVGEMHLFIDKSTDDLNLCNVIGSKIMDRFLIPQDAIGELKKFLNTLYPEK